MFDSTFNSESEINEAYTWLLESLLESGLSFNEDSLRAEWAEAVNNFREGLDKPPWLA